MHRACFRQPPPEGIQLCARRGQILGVFLSFSCERRLHLLEPGVYGSLLRLLGLCILTAARLFGLDFLQLLDVLVAMICHRPMELC